MQSKFHVGQKVICIGIFSTRGRVHAEILPQKGLVYTVRGHRFDDGVIGLYLEEIINRPAKYKEGFNVTAFGENWFAPLENIKVEWSELANKELVLN